MKYFVMSRRFNKRSPEDFGLLKKGLQAMSPLDNSIWRPKELYDFGWGKENGFYKEPLPNFKELMDIILGENDEDDIFGAAAIILESYPKELLLYLESLGIPSKEIKEKLNKVFHLKKTINRSLTLPTSLDEINAEYKRWLEISKRF